MPGRGISVSQYEVVASQALKNLQYLTTDFLLSVRSAPRGISPATWTDGKRRQDRHEFFEVLLICPPILSGESRYRPTSRKQDDHVEKLCATPTRGQPSAR